MTHTEMTRRERKKGETRRRIFEAAVALFRERGFEATTVDDITEKADVARGTFFNYFPRKEAVLAFLSAERLERAHENAAALFSSSEPARRRLVGLYRFAAAAYEEDRDLSRFVFAEWMARGLAPENGSDTRWHDLVMALVEQGRASGELRSDIDAVRIEAMLTGLYFTTVYEWLFCPEESAMTVPDLQGEIESRLDALFDGVASRTGGRA